jgi:hypothetical protein
MLTVWRTEAGVGCAGSMMISASEDEEEWSEEASMVADGESREFERAGSSREQGVRERRLSGDS